MFGAEEQIKLTPYPQIQLVESLKQGAQLRLCNKILLLRRSGVPFQDFETPLSFHLKRGKARKGFAGLEHRL